MIEPEKTTEVTTDPNKPPKKRRSRYLEAIETIVVAFFLAILIRATVAEARYIPSLSMEPTLLVGDRLIIEKVSSYFTTPHRGDILVFYPPNPYPPQSVTLWSQTLRWLGFTTEVAYIKRVVGLPGETVEVKDGKVLINGKALQEDYIKEPPFYTFPEPPAKVPFKIPSDSLFMMGDNRNNSQDSHKWGPLPMDNIIGKAVIRFWPLARLGPPI